MSLAKVGSEPTSKIMCNVINVQVVAVMSYTSISPTHPDRFNALFCCWNQIFGDIIDHDS